MDLPDPLFEGRLLRRYKRFLADVALDDGAEVTAHCPNPGAMLGVAPEGGRVWLSHHDSPKRKLKYTWELVEADDALIGINTGAPNRIAEEAVRAGRVAGLPQGAVRREVKYGRNSRIDLLIEPEGAPPCFVEVKNVHLSRQKGLAEFPDCVTARGAKHLAELADRVRAGDRAVMLFVVQRPDCDRFALARDIDAAYAKAFDAARQAGVEMLCYDCEVTIRSIVLRRRIEQID
ncbi:MAG: DNA/RNA nuclease SfsA [Pseudomonadota bacterium]